MSKISPSAKLEIQDKKMQFGMWLGLPPGTREPRTQAELATQLGVLPPQLSKWANDPIVLNAKQNALQLFFGRTIRYNVLKKLAKRATEEGHVPSARLLLEFMGDVGKQQGKGDNIPHEYTIKIVAPKEEDGTTGKSSQETEGADFR